MPSPRSDRLECRELGAGNPVVLINGYAATKDDWDPAFVQELSRGARVVCLDNRGMGESPLVEGELTVGTMAGDVIELMDALGIEHGDVIGWSMGGFIAQEVAATVPERVNRLVLLSTDPGGPGAQERAIDRWHDEPADGRLAAITAPALIACGAEDVVIPAVNTERLAEALPGSRREIFAGGGHAFMAQEPVGLAATVNAWLGR